MVYKYVLLKTSWGIVIFLDFNVLLNPKSEVDDIQLTEKIFLRISGGNVLMPNYTFVYWFKLALKGFEKELETLIDAKCVCFELVTLEFNYSDYQEEGIYPAIQGWFASHYEIKFPEIQVHFDKQRRKYIFELPQ